MSSNKITQIKTAIGNILTNVSSSGHIYAPYVPMQTTRIFGDAPLPSIQLHSNDKKELIYQFAVGKSYEFTFNYMKSIKPDETDFNDIDVFSADFTDEDFRAAIRRHVYEFKSFDKLFISQITEVCNRFYYLSEHTKNKADDYNITFVCKEKEVNFSANEFIDILDQGIIRELPPVSVGERELYNDSK